MLLKKYELKVDGNFIKKIDHEFLTYYAKRKIIKKFAEMNCIETKGIKIKDSA